MGTLDAFRGRTTIISGATNDPEVIKRTVAGCQGVLTVLVPEGVNNYSSGTAQVVLDHACPGARDEAPAIVGCTTPSAPAYASPARAL
jgi:hypothetical protein